MFNLINFLNPRRARTLPKESTERTLSLLALRQLWHQVFDPCPLLLKSFSPDGKSILEPFLDYAEAQQLSMNWRLHLHLLEWLKNQPAIHSDMTASVSEELIAAAAARWAMTDLSNKQGILIRCPQLKPGRVIGSWKSSSLVDRRKVVSATVLNLNVSELEVSYCILETRNLTQHLSWKPLNQGE